MFVQAIKAKQSAQTSGYNISSCLCSILCCYAWGSPVVFYPFTLLLVNLLHFELWDLELLTSFLGSSKYRQIVEIDGTDTKKNCFNTVDGSEIRLAPVELNSLSHKIQGFIHPRWLVGISSINSINQFLETGPFHLAYKKCFS